MLIRLAAYSISRHALGQLLHAGITRLARQPLHMLVPLAGPGSSATVVKAQTTIAAQQLRHGLKIAQFQRGQLFKKLPPRQNQVVQADGEFIQDDGVLTANRPHCQGWVWWQKWIEVRVTRPTG